MVTYTQGSQILKPNSKSMVLTVKQHSLHYRDLKAQGLLASGVSQKGEGGWDARVGLVSLN